MAELKFNPSTNKMEVVGLGGNIDTAVNKAVTTPVADSTNNLYSGLVNGVPTTLGQDELSKFDAGTITQATVGGENYSSLGSDGGFLGSLKNQDWSTKGLGGTLLGAGQLGLGVMSYLDNKKTADLQRNILSQQAKANDYSYNKTVADNQHVIDVFNQPKG